MAWAERMARGLEWPPCCRLLARRVERRWWPMVGGRLAGAGSVRFSQRTLDAGEGKSERPAAAASGVRSRIRGSCCVPAHCRWSAAGSKSAKHRQGVSTPSVSVLSVSIPSSTSTRPTPPNEASRLSSICSERLRRFEACRARSQQGREAEHTAPRRQQLQEHTQRQAAGSAAASAHVAQLVAHRVDGGVVLRLARRGRGWRVGGRQHCLRTGALASRRTRMQLARLQRQRRTSFRSMRLPPMRRPSTKTSSSSTLMIWQEGVQSRWEWAEHGAATLGSVPALAAAASAAPLRCPLPALARGRACRGAPPSLPHLQVAVGAPQDIGVQSHEHRLAVGVCTAAGSAGAAGEGRDWQRPSPKSGVSRHRVPRRTAQRDIHAHQPGSAGPRNAHPGRSG